MRLNALIVAGFSLALLSGGCDSPPDQPIIRPAQSAAVPAADPPIKRDQNGVPLVRDPELDVPADACDEALDDHELVGRWEIVSAEVAGNHLSVPGYYEFRGTRLTIVEGRAKYERVFELDSQSEPKRLDSRQTIPEGTIVFRAIYKLDGDTLTISDWKPFRARPDRFVDRTTPENNLSLAVLRRVHEAEKK